MSLFKPTLEKKIDEAHKNIQEIREEFKKEKKEFESKEIADIEFTIEEIRELDNMFCELMSMRTSYANIHSFHISREIPQLYSRIQKYLLSTS